MEGIPFITLSSLTQAMAVVLLTEEDLRTLIPPPAQAQITLITEFLERSIKLIDVCNAIIEQISEVQQWNTLLEVVIQSLGDSKGSFNAGHIRRAKKAMGELHCLWGAAEGQEEMAGHVHPHLHPSLRVTPHRCAGESQISNQLETLTLNRPKRWLSRNGNTGSLFEPARQLRAVASGLVAPKWSGGDVDESFGAAVHALNIISVFFLSTTMAALPNSGKSSTITINHPGSFLWVSYFLSMQEKVQDEVRKGKRTKNGNLWELGQIFSIIKRLTEVTEPAHEFPLPEDVREEIRNLVKQLRQYVEELDRDLQCLHDQMAELHNRLRSSRVGLLDHFSYGSIS